jgi:hypothetical protein
VGSGGGGEVAALLAGFIAAPLDPLKQDPRVRGLTLRQLRDTVGGIWQRLLTSKPNAYLYELLIQAKVGDVGRGVTGGVGGVLAGPEAGHPQLHQVKGRL